MVGESKICDVKKQQDCRIHHVELIPAKPKALPAALEAIREADLLLLGPGSLYTSVIPNLLVAGVPEAIRESDALKIYICNIMTQDGETEGYTAADHLEALMDHGAKVDLCLANSAPVGGGAGGALPGGGRRPPGGGPGADRLHGPGAGRAAGGL